MRPGCAKNLSAHGKHNLRSGSPAAAGPFRATGPVAQGPRAFLAAIPRRSTTSAVLRQMDLRGGEKRRLGVQGLGIQRKPIPNEAKPKLPAFHRRADKTVRSL